MNKADLVNEVANVVSTNAELSKKKRWPKRRRKKGHLTPEDDGESNFKGRMREDP